MIQNAYLSVNRITLITAIFFSSFAVSAQRNPKPKLPGSDYQNFLKTQWWLGLRFGTNIAQPNPVSRYTSISPIDYELEDLDKTYSEFNLPGIFIGLDLSFYYHGFSIGLQPSFKQMRYGYVNNLDWIGDVPTQNFSTQYDVEQRVSYIELPISVKYEIIKKGKIRPFILAGMHYSFVVGADKHTDITHTDYSTGEPRPYSGGSVSLNTKDQFQNYYGALGGIGTGFDFFNIRTVLEVTYMYGLSSITDTNSRNTTTELTTLGEVNDDLKLNQINISLSFVFPLRYIDKTFQPY
ncbi:MAG: outer membrane beta-barrel protein [Reichenbachiella sp.]